MSALPAALSAATAAAQPAAGLRKGGVGIDPKSQSPTGAWERSGVVLDTGGVNPWTNVGSAGGTWSQATPGNRAQQTAYGVLADGVQDNMAVVGKTAADFFNVDAWSMIFRCRMEADTTGRLFAVTDLRIERTATAWLLRVNGSFLLNVATPFADSVRILARGNGVDVDLNVGTGDPGEWITTLKGPLDSLAGAPNLFHQSNANFLNGETSQHYLFDQYLDRETMEQNAIFIEAVNP